MSTSAQTVQIESALRQARRERRRGCHRKEMLLLRKAVHFDQSSPTLWNRYALSCLRGGRREEALQAFSQSAWLDKRCGNARRAAVTMQLAERAREGSLILS